MVTELKSKLNSRSRDEWERLILQWVHNEKDRKMLIRKLLDGFTYEEIAEEFDLSIQQIKSRIRSARLQLFKHL